MRAATALLALTVASTVSLAIRVDSYSLVFMKFRTFSSTYIFKMLFSFADCEADAHKESREYDAFPKKLNCVSKNL